MILFNQRYTTELEATTTDVVFIQPDNDEGNVVINMEDIPRVVGVLTVLHDEWRQKTLIKPEDRNEHGVDGYGWKK